ncbi:MAG: hypothetical protein E6Q76_01240 [Rhizobium sp.]|nr:MAG: hypothetical protein E6Q76_01240 [Rhizobium sp.]
MNRVLLTAIMAAALSGCVSPNPVSTTSDGYRIEKFSHGSVFVGKSSDPFTPGTWSVDCPIDSMTDKRDCSISTVPGAPLRIRYGNSTTPQSVCVTGSVITALMRVDSNPPITTDGKGCVPASQIIGQLKTGTIFRARYGVMTESLTDPRPILREGTASLEGLNKAMETVADIQAGRLAVMP